MALRLLRRVGRTPSVLLSSLSSYHPKTLIQHPSSRPSTIKHNLDSFSPQSRTYISDMRKSSSDDHILRLISNEIQYELDRFSPTQLVTEFRSFAIDGRTGEQWIKLNKQFGENEEISLEVTMFEPPTDDGDTPIDDDVELYITMVINVYKDKRSDGLEIVCNVWPDSVEIDKVLMRDEDGMARRPYVGPPFHDLDDKLQTSLYDFLETRGVNDELAVFLHKYMQHKRKSEYIRWLGNVKSFVSRKIQG